MILDKIEPHNSETPEATISQPAIVNEVKKEEKRFEIPDSIFNHDIKESLDMEFPKEDQKKVVSFDNVPHIAIIEPSGRIEEIIKKT